MGTEGRQAAINEAFEPVSETKLVALLTERGVEVAEDWRGPSVGIGIARNPGAAVRLQQRAVQGLALALR